MAKFGEGVNAQLGATNYNAYLQGALQGAQGVARGGELMGQGIASVGSSIAGGIKEYQQNKKNNQALEGSVKSTLKLFESVDKLEGVSPEIKAQALSASKQLTDPNTPLAVRAAFAQQSRSDLGELMKLGQSAKEEKVKNETYELYSTLERTRGQVDSDFVNKFGPEAQANASKLFYVSENLKRQNEKLRAEATALGNVKEPDKFNQAYAAVRQDWEEKNPGGEMTGEVRAQLIKKAQEISSTPPVTNINSQTDFYAQTVQRKIAEENINLYEMASKAAKNSLPRLWLTKELLDKGNVNTGIFAELSTEVDRLRSQFLSDKKAGKRVSNTQMLDALTGSRVFSLFQQLGVGAKGLDTPAERDFMIAVLTGTKKFELATLQELTDLAIKEEENIINEYNKRVDRGTMDRFFTESGLPKERIEFASQKKDGVRTWDPATGTLR